MPTLNEQQTEELLRILTDQQRDLFSDPDGHSQEAAMLKKAWYNHVLLALEKLDSAVDRVSNEIHDVRTTLYKEIIESKESLRTELVAGDRHNDDEIVKLEKRLIKALDDLARKVEELEKSPIKENIEKNLSSIREATNTKIAPIKEDLASLKTKMAMWAALFGAAGSALLAGVIKIMPYIIKFLTTTPTP
jgi:hypothetical protein